MKTREGYSVTGLFGAVTGIDSEMIPDAHASDLSDVDCEDGVPKPRKGYRNVIAQDTNQTTNKGFAFNSVYVAGVQKEVFVSFDKRSGTVKPYEIAYDDTNDVWSETVITQGGTPLSLSDTYWRTVPFGSHVYCFNPNDSSPMNRYQPGTVNSWASVNPPADPTGAPTVEYFLNEDSRTYARYIGAQTSYDATDVTVDGTVATTAAMAGQAVKITIEAAGHFTVTMDLKHSGTADLTYCDVFAIDVQVNDTTKIQPLLKSLKASMTSSNGPTTQELQVSVVSETNDSSGKLKSVKLYLKFLAKGTRATWSTTTSVTIEGDVAEYSADDYIFFSPLTAGGMVDWGTQVNWRLMYTYYSSTTTWESGPSLAKSLDRAVLDGQYLAGNVLFPMGTVPRVTVAASSGADYFRLYAQNAVNAGKFSAWRRVVEQADSDTTYTYATLLADFSALLEYAPASFDFSTVLSAFRFKQSIVWGYPGGTNNLRVSRYQNAIAQASTDDAFKGDISQDDDFRGVNFTLGTSFPDQMQGGVELGNLAVVLGREGVYLMADTENGLPKGFTPPRAVPGAPGCKGKDGFAVWHDDTGTPIVVYVAKGGDSIWAVRVPHGVGAGSLEAVTAYELSSLIRGSMDAEVFGSSALRDDEAVNVMVDHETDTLIVQYNTHAARMLRASLKDGRRQWVFYSFNTGQHASQWQKLQSVQWSKGFTIMGRRLNGALDEFYRANMKNPATTDRYVVDIDGSGKTPASLSATVLTFTLPTGWSSGTPFQVTVNGNGLTAGVTYYYGRVTATTASVYDTQAHAQAGGATGRQTLTNTGAWASGAMLPLGPEDGANFSADPYWTSKTFMAERRRVRHVFVDKKVATDSVDVTVTSDRQTSSAVTAQSGKDSAKFGPKQSGDRHKFKFTLSERHSGVRGFSTVEHEISQTRQK